MFRLLPAFVCALITAEKKKGVEAEERFPLLFMRKQLHGMPITLLVALIQLEQSCHLQSCLCMLYGAKCSLLYPSKGSFPRSHRVTATRAPSPICSRSRGCNPTEIRKAIHASVSCVCYFILSLYFSKAFPSFENESLCFQNILFLDDNSSPGSSGSAESRHGKWAWKN